MTYMYNIIDVYVFCMLSIGYLYNTDILVIKQDVSIWALTTILVLLRILVLVQMQHISLLCTMDLEQPVQPEN